MTLQGQRRAAWIALGVVLAVCIWPYREVLSLYPTGQDALVWTGATDPRAPGWAKFVFLEHHFIGYRPVMGLSFTLNTALLGSEPWAYRGVDVALHAAVGVLVFLVADALLKRPWAALAAATLFLASPIGESVVPFVARRSYSLGTALGLVAVLVALRGQDSWRTGVATAACLGLALLTNETAYVLVPVVLALSFVRRGGVTGARVAIPVIAVTALAIFARLAVMGNLGGYRGALTARVEDGVRSMSSGSSPGEIFALSWAQAVLPDAPSGDPPLLLAWLGPWPVAVGLLTAAGVVMVAAWRDGGRLGALLFAWTLGHAVLDAASGTWFVRMAYPMTVPVVLWLVWAVTWGGGRAKVHRIWLFGLLPLMFVLVCRMQRATPVQGLDRAPIRERYHMTRMVRHAKQQLAAVSGPMMVWSALPLSPEEADSALYWIDRALPAEQLIVQLVITDRTLPPKTETLEISRGHIRPVAGAKWAGNAGRRLGVRLPRDWIKANTLSQDVPTTVIHADRLVAVDTFAAP